MPPVCAQGTQPTGKTSDGISHTVVYCLCSSSAQSKRQSRPQPHRGRPFGDGIAQRRDRSICAPRPSFIFHLEPGQTDTTTQLGTVSCWPVCSTDSTLIGHAAASGQPERGWCGGHCVTHDRRPARLDSSYLHVWWQARRQLERGGLVALCRNRRAISIRPARVSRVCVFVSACVSLARLVRTTWRRHPLRTHPLRPL